MLLFPIYTNIQTKFLDFFLPLSLIDNENDDDDVVTGKLNKIKFNQKTKQNKTTRSDDDKKK